jgi:ECF sigma factor/Concanavalin A-like lectin/glucanases superfamily
MESALVINQWLAADTNRNRGRIDRRYPALKSHRCQMADSVVSPVVADTADPMFVEVYRRLKAMASRARLRGGTPKTLCTTELVHEVYLRMGDSNFHYQQPVQFFAYAARAMRHILTDAPRRRLTPKFDGDQLHVTLEDPAVEASAAANGAIDTGSGALRIGNNSIFSNEGFVGMIDEVRIYNRALSATDILNDMAVPVSETPPVDTVPPNGTIKINGGAASTNNTPVTLTLSASDASGVTQMRFSDDGVSFGAAVSYATSSSWSLSSGDGIKIVSVQYKDAVGNWSNAISANITLDTAAPILSGVSAVSSTPTTGTISWSTNEVSTTVVDYGTTATYGQSSPINSTLVLAHNLVLNGLSPATNYHYRVRSSDAAGNESIGNDAVLTTLAANSATPLLGAHVLLTQDESLGTNPAITPAINTQVAGSTLLVLSMGWNVNFAAPTDNYGNSWSPLSEMNVYAFGDFHTIVWAAPSALGGNGHTLSETKNGRPAGEISLGLIEVINGGNVQMVYQLASAGNETPGSVTVDGPATLIAIWGGDSFALSHTAIPDNGFVVFDSYLNLGPSSGVQVAIASKQVTAPGTYTVNWASTPLQNAACYLIAIQSPR